MPVNSPTLDVGDTYLYEALDPQHPASKVTTRRTIISSHNGEIQFSSLNIGHKHSKPRSLYFTNDWNLVRIRNAAGNSGLDYSPPLKYYDFPLYPGKTWQQTTTETNITTGKTRIHTISGVVGPWEDVSVPAGRFRAIKVILRTELFDPATGERVNGADTSWYVPEVHRSVRTLETGKDGKERLIELTYYHLMSGQARFASSRIIQPTSGFVNADAFGRYAVSVYRGPSATPDFYSLPGSRRFRTRIRDGIRQGVNFAGHYAIVTFGCGTDCSSSFLVDVKSGQIFTFPLGGEGNYNLSLDYHADSALIKASWIAGNDPLDNPICVHQELVLRGTAFTSLRQTETKGKCER
jgi:hypothetical protein